VEALTSMSLLLISSYISNIFELLFNYFKASEESRVLRDLGIAINEELKAKSKDFLRAWNLD